MLNLNKKVNILLVEDDPIDVSLIKAMLPQTDSEQYEVICCPRLSEAVATLSRTPVDIVLLDLNLPDSTGLDTVYGIIKRHGGHIWVYSEPEQGTTFEIYLPTSKDAVMSVTKSRTGAQDARGTETIMVVEDDTAIRSLAVKILERNGYLVLFASSGLEGIEVIKGCKEKVDLLVTDIKLPEINGSALYDKVCRMIPDLKVLYMSGYTNEIIRQSGLLNEEAPFIQKPFTLQELVVKVRQVLDDV